MATINEWTNRRARLALVTCLSGAAAERVKTIPVDAEPDDGEDDAADFDDLLDLYEARFILPGVEDAYAEEFLRICQEETEDVLSYHSRIMDCFERAYPELADLQGGFDANRTLIKQFISRLRDEAVRDAVRDRRPQTMQEALAEANLATAQARQKRRDDAQFAAQISAMQPSAKRARPSRRRSTTRAAGHNQRCYRCRLPGHLARDCRQSTRHQSAPPPQRGQPRGRGRPTYAAAGYKHTVQAVQPEEDVKQEIQGN